MSCASAKNRKAETSGSTVNNVLTHESYTREYITYEPAIYDKTKKLPQLLVLHGGGGTNKQIIKHTKSRFNQLADRDKFYVVYPQGLEKGWNDGRNDLQQFASQNSINDVDFIRVLIHKLQNNSTSIKIESLLLEYPMAVVCHFDWAANLEIKLEQFPQ